MTQRILFAPGMPSGDTRYSRAILNYGKQLRDEYIWQLPLLPGALITYQDMAAGREWKIVSSTARAAARATEYLNNATTAMYDGALDVGFEGFVKRRVVDHLCMGMKMFGFRDGEPLRYLDPFEMSYNMEDYTWQEGYSNDIFTREEISVDRPIPLGNNGLFMAPIVPVIPTAQLAWLLREHDRASADGRKLRDIFLVLGGEDMEEKFGEAVKLALELWAGADPSKTGIAVIGIDSQQAMSASDYVARVGLANIPDGFDRDGFQFEFVNEVASVFGLSLRHIWNSEKATNRALEEVQETRQQQKGPSAFIRTEQRLYNNSGMLKQFGGNTRFAFIEEVDLSTRKTNAEVLKLFAEGLQIFTQVFNATVNGKSFLAWLQSEDILPSDIDLIAETQTVNPDKVPTPQNGAVQVESDATTVRKTVADDFLDYDEVAMLSDGSIIERRFKVFNFEKALQRESEESPPTIKPSFQAALKRIWERNYDYFKSVYLDKNWSDKELAANLYNKEKGDLKNEDYRNIKSLIDDLNMPPRPKLELEAIKLEPADV